MRQYTTVFAWGLALLVPFLMLQPSLVGLVSGPDFFGHQWEDENGMWWALMNGAVALSYLAWMARWATASHHHWALRSIAVALLVPGFFLAVYCVIMAAVKLNSWPEGANYENNESYRVELFTFTALSTAVAIVLIALDRRRAPGRV